MTRSATILTWAGPLLAVLPLIGCQSPAPAPRNSQASMDAAILETCRQRANEIYDKQNRAEIYSPQYNANTPLSGTYVDSALTRGLSARYAYEQMVQQCVRTASVTTERGADVDLGGTPIPPPPPAPPSSRR